MSGYLLGIPKFLTHNSNGVPLEGGKLYSYHVGTDTPKSTFSDLRCTIPNTNPVILDSRGEASIYLNGATKLILTGPDNDPTSPIWTWPSAGTLGDGTSSASIYDYGAVGDGVTDDTAAIQAAFDSGYIIHFPYGETFLTGQLTIPDGLHIEGNGSTFERNLVTAPGSVGWGGTGEALLKATTAVSNIIIRNFKFQEHQSDSATMVRSSIWFSTDVTDALIEGCEFIDDYMGVQVISTPYGTAESAATRVTIRDCKMYGGGYVADDTAVNLLVDGNRLAILGSKATYCVIEDNYVENAEGLCLLNARPDGSAVPYAGISENAFCRITNNICVNTSGSTIYVFGKDCIISNNTLYRPGGVGIVVGNYTDPVTSERYSKNVVISDNAIQGAGRSLVAHGSCITCWADNSTVIGNSVRVEDPTGKSSATCQAFSLNATNITVTGNSVDCIDGLVSNTYFVFLQGADKCSITGNSVRYIDIGVASDSLTANDYMAVTGNRFEDMNYGVYIQSPVSAKYWNVTGNIFESFTNYGIYLVVSLVNSPHYWTINNNQFVGNASGAYCIYGAGVGRLTLIGNSFSGTRQNDVVLDDADGNGPIFGDGNVSDGLCSNAAYIANPHGKGYPDTGPTVGTWLINEISWTAPATSAGKIGNVCTVAGTLGTLNSGGTTGSISINTKALTVNSATGLYPGCYITIAGVAGIKKVTAVSGTAVTVDTNSDATVVGAAVAFSAPTFKTWGVIS